MIPTYQSSICFCINLLGRLVVLLYFNFSTSTFQVVFVLDWGLKHTHTFTCIHMVVHTVVGDLGSSVFSPILICVPRTMYVVHCTTYSVQGTLVNEISILVYTSLACICTRVSYIYLVMRLYFYVNYLYFYLKLIYIYYISIFILYIPKFIT